MKKLFKLLFALILTTTILTACGSESETVKDDPIVGVWKLVGAAGPDQEMERIEYPKDAIITTYEFLSNNKINITDAWHTKNVVEATWQVKDNIYLIELLDDEGMAIELVDGEGMVIKATIEKDEILKIEFFDSSDNLMSTSIFERE